MMDLNIFGTIKGLITNQIEIVGDDIRAVHAEIVAACFAHDRGLCDHSSTNSHLRRRSERF